MFIYTCPSDSSIKERMLYASSRANVIGTADDQGLKISKKVCLSYSCVDHSNDVQIEGSSPDEITGARLNEEINPPVDEGPKRGFARPRRPGR
jgi:twinfilin-like protein